MDDAPAAAARGWLSRNAALLLLGLALAGAAVLLLSFASGLTFFQDTWEFLMNRRGVTAAAYLEPHNEHIVLIPVAIEQLLLRLFGMTSTMPEFVVLTALLLATAAVTFTYVRRRIGPWPALMAALLVLFLGPAWQVLLWPFEIGFVGSVLFGIAMLLGLDRGDRRADVAACLLLAISIGFSSLGLAFGAAAVVDVLQRRRSHGLRRAYLAVVPLLLYAAWYAGWGHHAESHVSLHNVLTSPRYVAEGLVASIDSLLALSTIAGEAVGRSAWGIPLLVALVALLVYGQVRRPGVSPRLWPVAAAAAAFWFLAAFNYVPGREPYQSRYLYGGSVFMLLLAADLLRGRRFGRRALLAAGLIVLVAASFNVVPLREGRDWFRQQTTVTRSDLSAIEIAHRTIEPSFSLTPEIAGTSFLVSVEAGPYLAAVREYGSPAYSQAELARAPAAERRQADVLLANALPVTIETEAAAGDPAPARRGRCVTLGAGDGSGAPVLRLRPGSTSIRIAPGAPATLRLARFAGGEYPLVTEGVAGASTTLLRIPPDAAHLPWRLEVDSAQGATVCR
jgi:hypothetical protein